MSQLVSVLRSQLSSERTDFCAALSVTLTSKAVILTNHAFLQFATSITCFSDVHMCPEIFHQCPSGHANTEYEHKDTLADAACKALKH